MDWEEGKFKGLHIDGSIIYMVQYRCDWIYLGFNICGAQGERAGNKTPRPGGGARKERWQCTGQGRGGA